MFVCIYKYIPCYIYIYSTVLFALAGAENGRIERSAPLPPRLHRRLLPHALAPQRAPGDAPALHERVVCERSRDLSRTTTSAGGLSLRS